MKVHVADKRQEEKHLVEEMITLYCRKTHGTKDDLCQGCGKLLEYSLIRLDRCPCMETKSFCSNCRVHCYEAGMREKIRQVMRFSGKRLLCKYPVKVMKHLLLSIAEKRRLAKSP